MNYFRIPDLGSKGYVFGGNLLKNHCSLIFLLIKLAHETIKSMKKVGFIIHPYFYVPYSRIRDPRFGIRCFFTPGIRDPG
jgi:hypothetical protein